MTSVETYKDSLRFNQYDLHVIVSGFFNDTEYFSAKVINVFPVLNYKQFELSLVEIILLYKITRQDGIFVKRHLQNYSNVHTVLVSHDVGKRIEELLRNIDRNNSVLISFTKLLMHQKHVKFKKHERKTCFFILPGFDIVITTSHLPIHYIPPSHHYSSEHEEVPLQFIKLLNMRNIVYISELQWYVNDLKVVSIKDKDSYTDKNTKSNGFTEKSVLWKKLNPTTEKLQSERETDPKQCACFLKNRKLANTNNLPIKDQTVEINKLQEITEVKQDTPKISKVDKVIEVQGNKEIVPFRIIDEKVDTRCDVSHLYWVHR